MCLVLLHHVLVSQSRLTHEGCAQAVDRTGGERKERRGWWKREQEERGEGEGEGEGEGGRE